MEPEERRKLESRLREITDKLGLLNPKQLGIDPPEGMELKEFEALYEERDEIIKKLGMK